MQLDDNLTGIQKRIIGVVALYIIEEGYSPSVREIGEALGIKSSSVQEQIEKLVGMGYLMRDRRKARTLRLTVKGEGVIEAINEGEE